MVETLLCLRLQRMAYPLPERRLLVDEPEICCALNFIIDFEEYGEVCLGLKYLDHSQEKVETIQADEIH